MMINVDLTATVFWKSGPLIDIVAKLLGKRRVYDLRGGISERERNKLVKGLKNLKIRVIYRKAKQSYTIINITPKDALSTIFCDAYDRKIDVASYFQKNYKRLAYPHLPCVIVKKDIFLPIEMCEVIEVSKFLFIFDVGI